MLKMIAPALLAPALAAPADAQEVELTVDNVITDRDPRGIIEAVVKVRNISSRPISAVYVECAFMNGLDQATDTGIDFVSGLPPGGVKYAKPSARFIGSMIQQRCYVDTISR